MHEGHRVLVQYVSYRYPSLHWVFQEKMTLGKRRMEHCALRTLTCMCGVFQKLEPAKFIIIHIETRAATVQSLWEGREYRYHNTGEMASKGTAHTNTD